MACARSLIGGKVVTYGMNPQRTALLVIDMTNDFLRQGAPLEAKAGRAMVPQVRKLIEFCRSQQIPVIYTTHVHRVDGSDMGRMADLFPIIRQGVALKAGTEGVEIYHDLKPRPGEPVIEKHRYSAFYNTDLEILLRNKQVDTLIISGVATNVCCESTAREAMFRDFKVIFLSDCNATYDLPDLGFGSISDQEIQKVVLTNIAMHIGQVMTSEQVMEVLSKKSAELGEPTVM
jgi:nicotinamidase-related amidase